MTSPAEYLKSAREIRSAAPEHLRPVRLAALSTSTIEILEPYLVVEGARRGLAVDTSFLPFGQLETLVFADESELYAARPNVVLMLARLTDLSPVLARASREGAPGHAAAELEAVVERLRALMAGLRERSGATIMLSNFEPLTAGASLADAGQELSAAAMVQRANEAVARICRDVAGAFVFDLHGLATELGSRTWRDPKLWSLGRIPFSAEAQAAIGARLARYLRALLVPARKCLVLDLDNVLWGGVLGEDGIGGIALGEDFPGITYKEFQRELLALRARGIMLAIASKNDLQDVRELFAKHPDMVLRLEHFSSVQVHWGDKVESLRAIARQLNIGLDALAFFDDAPAERERIRRALPDVQVIDVPESSAGFWSAIERSEVFDTLVISEDDRLRAAASARAGSVRRLAEASESVEGFLRSLEMRVRVGNVDGTTLPRVEQLLGKTNQFNLTSRRHTAAQVQRMISDGALALWARVSDKFGDNGLTGLAIARPVGDGSWTIDSLLLSCRVIGRGIEDVLLAELVAAIQRRGGRAVLGEYVPTARNEQVADFYPTHGFGSLDGQPRRWMLELPAPSLRPPSYIDVEHVDAA